MKKYYVVSEVSDPGVIGVVNGITQGRILREEFEKKENFDRFYDNVFQGDGSEPLGAINSLEITVESLRLLPKAKLTDFLQFGPKSLNCPFALSPRVVEVLRGFNLCEHIFIPAWVRGSNIEIQYQIGLFVPQSYELIDFHLSDFVDVSRPFKKRHFKLSSIVEYRKALAEEPLMRADTLHMVENFDDALDLFFVFGWLFVSVRLKEALEEIGITGAKILPAFGDVEGIKISLH